MFLIALALLAEPPPDLTDPYNHAVAIWASCARTSVGNAAAQSRRRDAGLVDNALRDCRPTEDALRIYLRGQFTSEEAERRVSEIRGEIRRSLTRSLRRLRR